MSRKARSDYRGPALFSHGFRPFFLMALLMATVSMLVWVAVYKGAMDAPGRFDAVDWHVHEMLFGYASAVIAGFLFTAIPNWTGRMPVRGWPLAALSFCWLAGRLALAGVGDLSAVAVMVIDCTFLIAVGAVALREIVAGRNWRNLMVLIPVLFLGSANVGFHAEIMVHGRADLGARAGLALVILLIMLIGGRIIPSFTRNWLVRSNPGPLPAPPSQFDALCLLTGAMSLTAWIATPEALVSAGMLLTASALHLIRLSRWRGWRTTGSPLLLVLHLAYLFIPLGLMTLGLGARLAGLHLLGIGAVSGMTLAVMLRATLGHTGRVLEIGQGPRIAFAALILAALIRSFCADFSVSGVTGLDVAAGLWTLCFALVCVRAVPWLVSPSAAKRTASKPRVDA